MERKITWHGIAALLLFFPSSAFAQAPIPKPSPALFTPQVLGKLQLKGSAFRHLGALNQKMRSVLKTCGKDNAVDQVPPDGILSTQTGDSLKLIRTCPGFDIPGEAGSPVLTSALWMKLLPDIPPPNAFERMFVVTLTLEGTDYDHLEWNYSAVDPTAFATWGPYGATAGSGSEIQTILVNAEKQDPDVVKKAFARAAALPDDQLPKPSEKIKDSRKDACTEFPKDPADDYALFQAITKLSDAAVGEPLKAAFCSDRRFGIWIKAFAFLGAQGLVRRAYDAVYFDPKAKVTRYIEATRKGYAATGAVATEIDVAMGMDGATQFSPRANAGKIQAAVASAGKKASPARRRQAISEKLPASLRNLKDRCGRDAVFFIDQLAQLPPAKACKGKDWDIKKAWAGRAGFSVSVVQLAETDAKDLAPGWSYDFDK